MSVSAAALTLSAAELSSGPANLSQAEEIQPSACQTCSLSTQQAYTALLQTFGREDGPWPVVPGGLASCVNPDLPLTASALLMLLLCTNRRTSQTLAKVVAGVMGMFWAGRQTSVRLWDLKGMRARVQKPASQTAEKLQSFTGRDIEVSGSDSLFNCRLVTCGMCDCSIVDPQGTVTPLKAA